MSVPIVYFKYLVINKFTQYGSPFSRQKKKKQELTIT